MTPSDPIADESGAPQRGEGKLADAEFLDALSKGSNRKWLNENLGAIDAARFFRIAMASENRRSALAVERAKNAELRDALNPFAVEAGSWGDLVPDDHYPVCVEMGKRDAKYYGSPAKYSLGDLRRAARVLADMDGGTGDE